MAREATAQNPLISDLFFSRPRLQEAARTGSKKYVRKGEEGLHIVALQQALNRLRTKKSVGYTSPSGIRCYPNWGLVDDDGKFGEKTFTALKAFQNWSNRENRAHTQDLAEIGFTPGTLKYKKEYNSLRNRVKRDGIAGPVTLVRLDGAIVTQNDILSN